MIFLRLVLLFLEYPVVFLRNMSWENFGKFFHALHTERRNEIVSNIQLYLYRQKHTVLGQADTGFNVDQESFISDINRFRSKYPGDAILFISHEATLTGAPLIIKQVAHDFHQHFGIVPIFILLKGGRISDLFDRHFPTYQVPQQVSEEVKVTHIRRLLHSISKELVIKATYVNSAESRYVLPVLRESGIDPIIMLVHEMGNLYPQDSWNLIDKYADHIIFPCNYVRDRGLENNRFLSKKNIIVRGQGLLKPEILDADREKCRNIIRRRLGVGHDAKIVLSCGTPIARKGIDLFVFTAISVLSSWSEKDSLYFVWLGDAPENNHQVWSRRDIRYSNYSDKIFMLDAVDDTIPWFVGSDIFFLTSRGDPYPCVVHEALAAGLQVVGFENTGGLKEMLPDEASILHDYGDVGSAAESIVHALQNVSVKTRGSILSYARGHLNFEDYSGFLFKLLHSQEDFTGSEFLKSDNRLTGTSNEKNSDSEQLNGGANLIQKHGDFSDTQTEMRKYCEQHEITAVDVGKIDALFNAIYPDGLVGKTFLDLNCNIGSYCFYAHQLGADYVLGIDTDELYVKHAQSLRSAMHYSPYEIDFKVEDLSNLVKTSEKFDFVFLDGVLENTPFPIHTLSEICLIAKESILMEVVLVKGISENALQLHIYDKKEPEEGVMSVAWRMSDITLLEKILFWNGFKYLKSWTISSNTEKTKVRLFASRRKQIFGQEDLVGKYRSILTPRIKDVLPVPPLSYMHYNETQERHLIAGKEEVDSIKICVENAGYKFSDLKTIFEFGCNNCRLLRWFYEGRNRELWGSDVNERMIAWCKENLGQSINLQLNDHDPPLNLPDNYFDLVFAGSIFTHIDKNSDQWIAELTRITAPGGLLYLTYLDENSMRILANEPHRPTFKKIQRKIPDSQHVWRGDFDRICIPGVDGTTDKGGGLIICHSNYIKGVAKEDVELVHIMEKAYAGYQTAYLFTKKTNALSSI